MNKVFINIILVLILFISVTRPQDMIAPESVAYDPVQKRYFISNFGNGNILEIDSLGNKQYFKTGLVKSIGMVIQYNVLYVVSNSKRITGFNLIDTSKSFELTIDEALFLNDITSDNAGNLYVTDSNAKMIYKINKNQESYTLFWNTDLTGPNGILYNKYKHNLIVCNFTENALIQSINLKDSTISVLDSTEFNNLDGLTIDEDGNIYVSLWDSGSFKTGFSHNGSVYKYDNGFQNNPQLIIENLYGPADIFYNIYKDELVIPLLLGNEVKYVSVEMD